MKLSGMNSVYRFYTLEYFFESMYELELENIELWTSPHHFFVDHRGYSQKDVEKVKKLTNKYKINIQCICPEQTNPKVGNLAVEDKYSRDRMLSYFQNQITLAKELDASKVLITAGWGYLNENRKLAWNRSVTAMKELCNFASQYNINIVIEALQPDESNLVNNINDLKKYLEDVNHSNLKICIDFGAMARADETLKDYLNEFPLKIEHVHLVDGKPTGHLALGDGTRNLKQDVIELKKYGYKNYLTLETVNSKYYMNPKTADKQSINTYQQIKKEVRINHETIKGRS